MIADDSNSDSKDNLGPTPQPTPDSNPLRPSRDHKRTTVRFSDEEYDRITEETQATGKSVPALLKAVYFGSKKLKLLFSKSDAHSICVELRRIGNNINQIAKRVNSGAVEGWYPEFEEIAQKLSEMHLRIVGAHGVR